MAWWGDPSLMMADCGLTPDPWQAEVLRSSSTRILMVCSRQSGKSTTVACMGLHQAICHPGSLVLMFSPSLRQSGELYRKTLGFYRDLGRPIPAVQETATTLDLSNGSRIVSLPGSHETIRGFSKPALIVVDEASMVADSLFVGAMPMLAASPGGRLVMLSTPFGERGYFFEQFTGDNPIWERYKVTAEQCPRISPEFLEEQKLTLGERWYNQEFMCSFEEAMGQVFSTASIERAFDSDMEVWYPRSHPKHPDNVRASTNDSCFDDKLEVWYPRERSNRTNGV